MTNMAAEFLRTISREEVADLPIRRYEGNVLLVDTSEDRDRAMADILQERVIGFDTETRPAFHKGQSYLPCLAQVATARCVYLFRLAKADYSRELAHLLEAPRTVKAGVAISDDLRQLKALFHFDEKRVVDPGVIASRHGLSQTGLRNLAAIFLGFRIPKGNRTSNWAAQRLNPAQIAYAATDAWACRELYLRFEEVGLLEKPLAA
jgi:ribonuclease D